MDVIAVAGAPTEQPAPQAAEVTEEATQIATDAATEQTQIQADAATEQTQIIADAQVETARLQADTLAATSQAELMTRLSSLESKQATDHEAVCDAISMLAGAETVDEIQPATEGAIPVEKTDEAEPKGEKTEDQDLKPKARGFLATIFLGRPRK